MVFNNNRYHSAKLFNVTAAISGHISYELNSISDFFALRENNRKLAEENVALRSQLISSYRDGFTEDITKNDERYKQQYTFTSAEVVGNSVNKQYNYITINKGSKQGIETDMAVICDEGIVGIVGAVSDNFSLVLSVLNLNSRISSKLKDSGYYGALVWEGKSSRFGLLTDIPQHAEISVGDTIITSGLSAIFPEGIPIGTIDSYSTDDGNFHTINVKFLMDFNKIKYVSVVKNHFKEEQKDLEKNTVYHE